MNVLIYLAGVAGYALLLRAQWRVHLQSKALNEETKEMCRLVNVLLHTDDPWVRDQILATITAMTDRRKL